ncbi:MAG: hypothetical protein LBU57_01585 [Dysgonamonadaceae bacterium]|jgi:hypothetical protein|nr:hypothetical protein [Dysgonamonadaceae bacterium]
METKFTEKESLALISEMIDQARKNLQKGSGNSMIFNGLLVSSVALANIALAFILSNPNQSFWVWCLMIPGSFVTKIIDGRVDRESMVKTHIDSIIRYTWLGFACSVCILLAIIFMLGLGKKFYELFFLINPCIIAMTGLAEFITAKACRFKPYFFGAYTMWLGALLCGLAFWFTKEQGYVVIIQFFILIICMIVGFVIPGYQLNKKAKESCLKN